MELTQSMFATSAEYWKARAELAEGTIAELAEELKCEPDNERMLQAVHNLNWALMLRGELLDRCVDEGMAADAAEEAHTVEGPGVGAA